MANETVKPLGETKPKTEAKQVEQQKPDEVGLLRQQVEQQAKAIEALQQQVSSSADIAKQAVIAPLDRAGMPEDKLALLADYEVSFEGPDAAKWLQPVRVEAINGPRAVARTVKALGLHAASHRFSTKYLGKEFVVKPKDEKKAGEGFPRKVRANTGEAAVKLAVERTPTDVELEVAEV